MNASEQSSALRRLRHRNLQNILGFLWSEQRSALRRLRHTALSSALAFSEKVRTKLRFKEIETPVISKLLTKLIESEQSSALRRLRHTSRTCWEQLRQVRTKLRFKEIETH